MVVPKKLASFSEAELRSKSGVGGFSVHARGPVRTVCARSVVVNRA